MVPPFSDSFMTPQETANQRAVTSAGLPNCTTYLLPDAPLTRTAGKPVLERVTGRRAAGTHVDLAVDRAQVCMNGADADDQAFRNFRVGETVGDEREHLELAGRQILGCVRTHILRAGATNSRAASRGSSDLPPTPLRSDLSQHARTSASTWSWRSPNPTHSGTPSAARIASAAARSWTARMASPASGEKSRRLEHDHAEPTIAELDEEGQRLLELRGGRVGIAQVGVDFGEAQSTLPNVRRSPTARRMARLSSAWARGVGERAGGAGDGEAEEPERDSVRVAEPPEQQGCARRAAVRVPSPRDDEVHREPVERPRSRSRRRGPRSRESLAEERLCLRVVSSRLGHERDPVWASAMPFPSSSERDSASASRQSSSARRSHPGSGRGRRSRSGRGRGRVMRPVRSRATRRARAALAQVPALEPEAPEHGAELERRRGSPSSSENRRAARRLSWSVSSVVRHFAWSDAARPDGAARPKRGSEPRARAGSLPLRRCARAVRPRTRGSSRACRSARLRRARGSCRRASRGRRDLHRTPPLPPRACSPRRRRRGGERASSRRRRGARSSSRSCRAALDAAPAHRASPR